MRQFRGWRTASRPYDGWMETPAGYDEWFDALARLAKDRDMEWIVQRGAATHRESFARGASPDEELAALSDLAAWRGCGCGGS